MIRDCKYKKACGGCVSVGRPYEETLLEKEAYVRKLLAPFVPLAGITGMDDPLYYRNKVHRVYAYERRGGRSCRVSGIYRQGTHKVIEVSSCLLEDRRAGKILKTVDDLVRSFKIPSYDEDLQRGLLRHVLIRTAHATGEVMVVLVLTGRELPGKKAFVRALTEAHREIRTVVLNFNSRKTSLILGDRQEVVYGPGYIEDVLSGRRFRISASSFYQVNPVQTEKLYARAIGMAGLNRKSRVLDAYCGTGTIGIIAAEKAGEVTGVESNRAAVKDAAANARLNGIQNIRFAAQDAGEYLASVPEEERPDVIFMDPPRAGASEEFLRAAAAASPPRMVYISCCPETLARDLGILKKLGYRAAEAEAFDMFPWTDSVESCVLLKRAGGRKGI